MSNESKQAIEKFKSISRKAAIIKLEAAAVIISVGFAFIFILNSNVDKRYSLLYAFLVLLVNFAFLYFLYDQRKIDDIAIDSNHLRIFLLLIVFNIGSVSAYKYYDEYKYDQIKKEGHTVGLRAYGCEVVFDNLKIQYWDSINSWTEIPDKNLYLNSNWIGPLWISSYLKDSENFKIKDKILTLRNSGRVFNPALINKGLGSKNFQITASVILKSIDPVFMNNELEDDEKYHSIQFCIKVPKDTENKYDNDFYVAAEYFFQDFSWSKLRNPALDIDDFSGNEVINSEDEQSYIRNKILITKGNHVSLEKKLLLSAKIFNDNAILQIKNPKNGESKILYNGSINRMN